MGSVKSAQRNWSRASEATAPHARTRSVPTVLTASVLLFVGVVLGFWLGRTAPTRTAESSVRTYDAATVGPEPPVARTAATTPRRQPAAVLPPLPDELGEARAVGERQYRAQQAKRIVKGLRTRVALATARNPLNFTPETIVSRAWPFVEGWMSAVQTVAPEMLEDIGAEIDASLCDPAGEPTQQLMLLRVASVDPLFASQHGLACTIKRYTEGATDDPLLWSALDAWAAGQLPVTPEIEALASRTDERTVSRLALIRGEPIPEGPPDQESPALEGEMPPVEQRSQPDALRHPN